MTSSSCEVKVDRRRGQRKVPKSESKSRVKATEQQRNAMKVFFLVVLLVIPAANAKIFEKCELARALKASGMSGYEGASLADWVCLIHWESSYNTKAKNRNSNGSTDYGIFQINSRYWCRDDDTPGQTSNGCKINCSQLLDNDISSSVNCAKIIARQQGIKAWYGWLNNCKNKNVNQYIAGCGL